MKKYIRSKERRKIMNTTLNLCENCYFHRSNILLQNDRGKNSDRKNSDRKKLRAGVLLYNYIEDKILVVEVYNQFIGLPKGGKESGETDYQCAQRELKEETGIYLKDFEQAPTITLFNTCKYFIIYTDICFPVSIEKFVGNDATGVGWVHRNCLSNIPGGILTSHLKKILTLIFSDK